MDTKLCFALLTTLICCVSAFSVIPHLPDRVELGPLFFTDYLSTGYNITARQFHTVLTGLSALKDDFSYDCPSQTFQITIKFPTTVTAKAHYNFDARYGWFGGVVVTLNDVVGDLWLVSIYEGEGQKKTDHEYWTVGFAGDVVHQDLADHGIVFENVTMNYHTPLFVNTTVHSGTSDGEPIIGHELEEGIADTINSWIVIITNAIAKDSFETYLNHLFADTTMKDFIGMTGADCGGRRPKN